MPLHPATGTQAADSRAHRALFSGRYWKAKSVLAALALALLRTYPAYQALQTDFVKSTWQSAQVKFDHALTDMAKVFPPTTHAAKLTFRLTVPLLAHAFRLRPSQLILINAVLGVLLLFLVLELAHRATNHRKIAFLVTLCAACCWAGQAAFHEYGGDYYDTAAFWLMLLAISIRIAPKNDIVVHALRNR